MKHEYTREEFNKLPPFARHVLIVASIEPMRERMVSELDEEERLLIYNKHLQGVPTDMISEEHRICASKVYNLLHDFRKKDGTVRKKGL